MTKRAALLLILLTLTTSALAQQPARLRLSDGTFLLADFYAPNIIRVFHDPQGGSLRDPVPDPPASILVDDARIDVGHIGTDSRSITGGRLCLRLAQDGTLELLENGRMIFWKGRIVHEDGKSVFRYLDGEGNYYYGGGVQNGRFSHAGKQIAIENQNSWTDGGVCSPAPWFWSTAGYGMLWNTFTKGTYNFSREPAEVVLTHETPWMDLFIMTDQRPVDLLRDYYQLTGAPVLLPKFGFYEGHLNAYNRDYWTPDPKGILFEDGFRYKESQTPNGGIRESLNGELEGNYQFSARAVVDRYEAADMPLGWILPNDGYGAGYGQTETLDGNIQNLKEFGDYARSKGVEIGLWTQSDLHPVDSIPALLQRDIDKEVGVAGVKVLKTDVAWVGWGYSFGLNGISDAAGIMEGYGIRPFIITLDGWAGTQRYGGIWTGDQTGGQWEYIRFHIPTYIGAGLAGQPNVSSDMDGIFGGGNEWVNIRDFQWKTFTPMQLNMDGWGSHEKYPQALGSRAAEINRKYLKLKSELMPYTYTIAHEAVAGLPMIRAIFLEEPNPYTLGTATGYEFLYGPSLLVAPIYQETAVDKEGNDIRNGIYLPEGEWMDFFTDEVYQGGRVLNCFDAPLDKIPLFVRRGAILPLAPPHNNPSAQDLSRRIYAVYPQGETHFTEYDDDGRTEAYLHGRYSTTRIDCVQKGGSVRVTVNPARGGFEGMPELRRTEIRLHTAAPGKVKALVDGKETPVESRFEEGVQTIIFPETNVASELEVQLKGFKAPVRGMAPFKEGKKASALPDFSNSADALVMSWHEAPAPGTYREVEFEGVRYTNIKGRSFRLDGLKPATDYTVRVRDWKGQWEEALTQTKADPYENTIKGIVATCTAPSQVNQEIARLFDSSTDTEMWHTDWGASATPFDVVANLGAVYTLDKLEYVPRPDAGNGTIYRGTVSVSLDGKTWSQPEEFFWERDPQTKIFLLKGVQAQFVKVHVNAAVGAFGSGKELYIFKVPGTGSYKLGVFNEKGEAVESVN